MKIVIFGLSITSAWGNGHATTFRALASGLHRNGHTVVFFEKDVEWYAHNRDLPAPAFCEVRLYSAWREVRAQALRECADADVVMVGSFVAEGAQVLDDMLGSKAAVKCFYDIDTPITVAQLREKGSVEYLRADQLPELDIYFSFTGGPLLRELENDWGTRRATPLYCSVEPERYRRRTTKRYACDLSYMGTYAPDRQSKLETLLLSAATVLPDQSFVLAGAQYPKQVHWPENVRRITHLNPRWHPHLYSSSRLTLNITRREMVLAGYSPSVRLFEAAACAAAIVSDSWSGIDSFFAPGHEILLANSTRDVTFYLTELSEKELRALGEAAQAKVLTAHTYAVRAGEFEAAIEQTLAIRHPVGRAEETLGDKTASVHLSDA